MSEPAALDRPILVTGTPKSGKSLIAVTVERSREFCCLEEPLAIWETGAAARDDRRSAEEATASVTARIQAACARRLNEAGKQRYLDVLSYHALRVPFVRRVLPDVRIILVVRDPRLVIPESIYHWTRPDSIRRAYRRRRSLMDLSSLPRLGWRFLRNYVSTRTRGARRSWGPVVPGQYEFAEGRSLAELVAYQWLQINQIALEDLALGPRDGYLLMRYEDIVGEPAAAAERVASFCEVQEPEALVRFAAGEFVADHVDARQVPVSPEEWRSIRPMIAPLSQRLGYDLGGD